jgi:hypothetical protein
MILKERLGQTLKDLENQRLLAQETSRENQSLSSRLINLESEKISIDQKLSNLTQQLTFFNFQLRHMKEISEENDGLKQKLA